MLTMTIIQRAAKVHNLTLTCLPTSYTIVGLQTQAWPLLHTFKNKKSQTIMKTLHAKDKNLIWQIFFLGKEKCNRF